jgi:hypothetical protein
LTNLLQLVAMPVCIGRGVAMPFAPTVWVMLDVVVLDVDEVTDVGGIVVVRVTFTTAVGINEPPGGLVVLWPRTRAVSFCGLVPGQKWPLP